MAETGRGTSADDEATGRANVERLAFALAQRHGYSRDEWMDEENLSMRETHREQAVQINRLLDGLEDAYTEEGVCIYLKSVANKAQGLGGMVAT